MNSQKFKQTEIGKIPEDWQVKKIGEIFNVKNGKTNTQDAVIGGKYPLFDRSVEIKASNKFLFDSQAIIIAGEGKEFMPRYFKGKFDLHQRAYAITPNNKQEDFKFFFYAMIKFKDFLSRIAVGSTVKSLRINHLLNFPVPFPKEEEERKQIAQILSSLDAKIEINNKMNKTLETIGQTIFKRWFMDNPEKEKWEEGKLGDLGKIVTGKTPPTKDKENYGGEIPFLKIPDMKNIFPLETSLYLTEKGLATVKNMLLPKDCLNISCIGTLGLITINKMHVVTNQNVNSIIFNKDYFLYYVYLYSKESLFETLSSLGAGSVFGTVSKSKVEEITVRIPEKSILEEFHKLVKPIFEKIFNNSLQIQKLSQIRDSLLPKLMSGEIRVPIK